MQKSLFWPSKYFSMDVVDENFSREILIHSNATLCRNFKAAGENTVVLTWSGNRRTSVLD